MELWGGVSHPYTRKITLAATYAGVEVKPNGFFAQAADKDKLKEFKEKINPNGQVPALETPEGVLLESRAILRYIARSGKNKTLYGASLFE